MTRTHRLFQLMQALRNTAPPATAAGLAQTLGVTPRTIYRDIEGLRSLGAVIDGAAGFGYTLIEDAALPPLSFADEELEALVLGLREVGEVGDPAETTTEVSMVVKAACLRDLGHTAVGLSQQTRRILYSNAYQVLAG